MSSGEEKVVIYRPINGIGLNGNEYVLDDDGELMVFETEDDARRFLAACGIGEQEIEDMGIGFEPAVEVENETH